MEGKEDHLVFREFSKRIYGTILDFKARTGDDGANGGREIDSKVIGTRF